jgi:hypothetical protein
MPGWDLAASVYATPRKTDYDADAKERAGATAGARRPALAFEKRANSPRALVAAPPAERPPGGPTFVGGDPVEPPVAKPKGDPALELPPGVRAPLWAPADSAPSLTRPDAIIPWRELCIFVVLVVLAAGAYQAYPRAHTWWIERTVPADLHAYVEGNGVHYTPARLGFSVRLPKLPTYGDAGLGPQTAPWTVIHRAVVAGSDYRIVIRVGELASGGPLPFGLAGALADERFGGEPAPQGFRLVSFDDKPAYAFRVDGRRPLQGRVFRRGTRVYVVIVESAGARRVLDTLLSSFTLAGG